MHAGRGETARDHGEREEGHCCEGEEPKRKSVKVMCYSSKERDVFFDNHCVKMQTNQLILFILNLLSNIIWRSALF